jgi:hypothetical protein
MESSKSSDEVIPHPFFGDNGLALEEIASNYPIIGNALAIYEPTHTAAIFGGLLTVPELQCNCTRLEWLSHLAVANANGKKRPTKSVIANWFSSMSSGPCGRMEDPAEDAFTSLIVTPKGNFRLIEGIWESAGFYLQRIVNVVETMPDKGVLSTLRESVYSLLRLSDLICERSKLNRYEFGAEAPQSEIPKRTLDSLNDLRQRVTFSIGDLRNSSIELEHLRPFILDRSRRDSILTASIGNSPLLLHPILERDGMLVVALPSAISVTIRQFVIRCAIRLGMKDGLVQALRAEYAELFSERPPLKTRHSPPIFFRQGSELMTASYAYELDAGRYLQIILILDQLQDFEAAGFEGTDGMSDAKAAAIESDILDCRTAISKNNNFREGMTLIISCGVGRGTAFEQPEIGDNWRVTYLSAADVATLTLLRKVDALTVWRILDAEKDLNTLGVQIFKINGLLSLIAWVRMLDGHLIQHSNVPDGFGDGGRSLMVLDPSTVRELRLEAFQLADPHAVKSVSDEWIEVQKLSESYFHEDRSLPLYASQKLDGKLLPVVFLTATRQWWCLVTYPCEYSRWKLMNTWLPKIATVLDQKLPALPKGPISLSVAFRGYTGDSIDGPVPTYEEIRRSINVAIDSTRPSVSVETDQCFELGLASPTNISEAALVNAITAGFLELACDSEDRSYSLEQEVVPDDQARDAHIFVAKRYRDFIAATLPDDPVTIDEIDDAAIRLNLGWKIQEKGNGKIEGKTPCNRFLNSLVSHIEKELCEQLRQFDRSAFIEMALRNHEAAMIRQATWQRTAAAIVALHSDKDAALATIIRQEFKTNSALLASRVLVEFCVSECAPEGGVMPGKMDLSRMMARLLLAINFGGWSDAIYLDAMPPLVEVTPLGDVHADLSFFDDVIQPFGEVTQRAKVNSAVSRYAQNYVPANSSGPASEFLESEFADAWKDEFGFSVDDFRQTVDELEDYGIGRKEAVFRLRRSELLEKLKSVANSPLVVDTLSTFPRGNWSVPPEGFKKKDIDPWRFRRRLSVLRNPFVRIDDASDPELIVAPGLVRDALGYLLRGYYEGEFPQSQFKSALMKSWCGRSANSRGHKFAEEVEQRMAALGWNAEREVALTKILKMPTDGDLGDVDVLASRASDGRILLIECKDLQFLKTPGELAEQLSDFRGTTVDGKRDLLKKHLDRCALLRSHEDRVASYAKIDRSPKIESWVVFKNPVPMLFAWKELQGTVGIMTFEHLHAI